MNDNYYLLLLQWHSLATSAKPILISFVKRQILRIRCGSFVSFTTQYFVPLLVDLIQVQRGRFRYREKGDQASGKGGVSAEEEQIFFAHKVEEYRRDERPKLS